MGTVFTSLSTPSERHLRLAAFYSSLPQCHLVSGGDEGGRSFIYLIQSGITEYRGGFDFIPSP